MAGVYQIRLATDGTGDFSNTESRLDPPMYALKYPPSEFQIGNIAPQYAEIARPGNAPLTDFASESLVEISMSFVVGNNDMSSIETDLKILRAIANPPDGGPHKRSPVVFYNFPRILDLMFGQPGVRSLPYWRVTNIDFAIQSRMTSDQSAGGTLLPTRATVNLTCRQDNPSFLQSVFIPKFKYTYTPPTFTETKDPNLGLFWRETYPGSGSYKAVGSLGQDLPGYPYKTAAQLMK
jgi:hypothetical protein